MTILKIIPMVLGLLLATQPIVAAREIRTYRPAPRGLDTVPQKPIILRNNSAYRFKEPSCIGSKNCYNPRANRPVGPAGPTQAERCRAQYRSYRGFDNTYKPYNAPRRRCDL
ncbi:MAG: hypothetical protein ACRECY_09340 [Phyllobacterium sp.]